MAATKRAGGPAPLPSDSGLPKVIEVTVPGGGKVRPENLPIGVLMDIAERHDVAFNLVMGAPLYADKTGEVAVDVLEACCKKAGVKMPPRDKIAGGQLYNAFSVVDDDKPLSWDDDSEEAGPLSGDQTTT